MRALFGLSAAALVLACLWIGGACQVPPDPDSESPPYELTAAAVLVDLQREPPGANVIVEMRNHSRQAIDRVELFPYSRELADGIVYTEISSESIESPEPILDALFSRPLVAEDEAGQRRLLFKLSRDLEPADMTWLLIRQAERPSPLVTCRRSGAGVSVESAPFVWDLGKLVVGLAAGGEDRVEFRASSPGYVSASTAYHGVLLTNQIAGLSKLLSAAASMWDDHRVRSWPAAAYFGEIRAGETRTAEVVFVSPEKGIGSGDRGWILAAATLAGGGVIVAILIVSGRRRRSREGGDATP